MRYKKDFERLQEIQKEVNVMEYSEEGIKTIEELITEALRIAIKNKFSVLSTQIRQNKERQLSKLLDSKDEPKKTHGFWKQTKSHFRQDFFYLNIYKEENRLSSKL